uniref:Uncharacterized protein n=1 Tax=Vespula pensylvanica TaxID=30213 RepID=A0A834UFZ0_VESPE|nr:hypothetical protein H0235_000004 [Vespula pensylvanica]
MRFGLYVIVRSEGEEERNDENYFPKSIGVPWRSNSASTVYVYKRVSIRSVHRNFKSGNSEVLLALIFGGLTVKVGREGGGRHRVPFCPPEPRFIGECEDGDAPKDVTIVGGGRSTPPQYATRDRVTWTNWPGTGEVRLVYGLRDKEPQEIPILPCFGT